jgi:hypothetical protein
MGGVLANPLSSARPKDDAAISSIVTENIRAAEKRARILIIPFRKPQNYRTVLSRILTR